MMRQRVKDAASRLGNLMTGRDQVVDQLRRHEDSHFYLVQVFNLLAHATREAAANDPRRADPRRLLAYGYKGYSQGDEDGIIDEIFRRIGTTNRHFVEFGAGDGLQNNTTALVADGWRGAWLDGFDGNVATIQREFAQVVAADKLRVRQAFITAENIEALFTELGVPDEPDLLSIDIDGNDYWIWRAITHYRPRVVVIEYNATFGRSARCVVPYRPDGVWNYTCHYGAGLAALEGLGREKGYSLVGCCYQGTNAFFVRDDLLGDHFCAPYTAANHFEPVRYAFSLISGGHTPSWGDLEQV